MLLFFLGLLAIILASLTFRRRPTPAHCRCGRPADIVDHDRPWIVYCGRCWLKKLGDGHGL